MDPSSSRLRLWAALTSLAGLAALAVTVAFRLLPEVEAAGTCLPADAVIRFEFARTAADLQAIFGPCRPQAIAAMDAVNRLDAAAYIPSYAAFAALAAIFLGRSLRRPLVLLAVAAAATALVADYIETLTLLRITADLDNAAPLLATSSSAAWIKFAALAFNAVLLSAICLTATPRRPIHSALLILPVLATLVMAIDPSRSGLLSLAYLAGWTPLLLIAIRHAVTGRS